MAAWLKSAVILYCTATQNLAHDTKLVGAVDAVRLK